jgi:uncharacterized protein (TIGR00369 family)
MGAIALLPYADFLGITVIGERDGAPLLVMPYSEGLIGFPGRLHGGAVSGLLEIAAIAAIDATLDDAGQARAMFKPITVTIDFMRPGQPADTFACGEVVRVGERIANVAVSAWQGDADRLIAAARMNLAIGAPTGTAR